MTGSNDNRLSGPAPGEGLRNAAGTSSVLPALERLEQIVRQAAAVLREETLLLRSGENIDLAAFSERKGRLLMELSRTASIAPPIRAGDPVAAAVEDFRRALGENASVLEAHHGAVSEIVDILADNVRAAASDGTYERSIATRPAR